MIDDGTTTSNQITFNNFTQAQFIYQAPKSFTGIQQSVVHITSTDTNKKLLIKQTVTVKADKTIHLIPGIITIKEGDTTIYQTKSTQANPRNINITLPKDESDIQYIDESATLQINSSAIKKLRILVQDQKGNLITTVASITTAQGLLIP